MNIEEVMFLRFKGYKDDDVEIKDDLFFGEFTEGEVYRLNMQRRLVS